MNSPLLDTHLAAPATETHVQSELRAVAIAACVLVLGASAAYSPALPQVAGRVATVAHRVATGFADTFGASTDVRGRIAQALVPRQERLLPAYQTADQTTLFADAQAHIAAATAGYTALRAYATAGDVAQPFAAVAQSARTRSPSADIGGAYVAFGRSVIAVSDWCIHADISLAYLIARAGFAGVSTANRFARSAAAGARIAYAGVSDALRGSALLSAGAHEFAQGKRAAAAAFAAVASAASTLSVPVAHQVHRERFPSPMPDILPVLSGAVDALGEGVIAIAHAAINADVSLAYGIAAAAPASARAVFGAEYATAYRFVAVTDTVSTGYGLAVERAGRFAYEGVAGVGAFTTQTAAGAYSAYRSILDAGTLPAAHVGVPGRTAKGR